MKILQQPDISGQELSKRFYVPGLIFEAECPECDTVNVREYGKHDYVSYPSGGDGVESVYLCCSNCDHDWEESYVLRISATAFPHGDGVEET
jgi:hypothetical protein